MYGGLFGDLPATKNSKSRNDRAENGPKPDSQPPDTSNISSNPPPAKKAKAQTTHMFIPQAAMSRKRPSQPSRHTAKAKASSSHVPFVLSKPTTGQDQGKKTVEGSKLSISLDEVKPNELDERPSVSPQTSNFETETTLDTIEDPEELRALHASAMEDPYDPLVPNDLLLYWEQRERRHERERLEKEREAAIQAQRDLERKLEDERRSLLEAGRIDKIVDLEARGRGRGRGRGVSNLPAWLLEQKK